LPYCPFHDEDVELALDAVVEISEGVRDIIYRCPKCGFLPKFREVKEVGEDKGN